MWMGYFSKRYWQKRFYPELAALPQHIRDHISNNGYKNIDLPWRDLGIIVAIPTSYLGAMYGTRFFFPTRGTLENILLLLGLPWFIFFILAAYVLLRRAHKRWLHDELNRLNYRPDTCLLCGYDLRGTPNKSTACPECGATIAAITGEPSPNDSMHNPE